MILSEAYLAIRVPSSESLEERGGDRHGMKMPWSLRDNPASLVIVTIGVLVVLLTLGWLTLRVGSQWTHRYLQRQTQLGE